jgi:uncharacterized protein (DUF488 family)
VGHGTLGADDFAALLRRADVEQLVDVRRYPGSRRHPHFAREQMAAWLPDEGVGYAWRPDLGGRRRPDTASPNTGLRNPQFRAYADHMQSDEFRHGIEELVELASDRRTVVMCAESLWWRCHRRLIADHLVLVAQVAVVHLFHDGKERPHAVTDSAHGEGGAVVYREPTLFDAGT